MENHHVSWENSLFLWPNYSYFDMTRPGIPHVSPFRNPRHRHGHDAQPLILGLLPFQRPLRAQVLHKATRKDASKGAWSWENTKKILRKAWGKTEKTGFW